MPQTFTVNAFTQIPAGGNPAGVVLDAQGLSDADMQAMATQLNLSETAFVLPSETATFRVRFFTPTSEVDLCGHATIATFALLATLGHITPGNYTEETRAGIMAIEVQASGLVFMSQAKPQFLDIIPATEIGPSLKITPEDFHPDLPCQIVSTGLRDIIIPIKDMMTLFTVSPTMNAIRQVSQNHDVVGYHLFSLDTLLGNTAHCRNFAPRYGILEEAATGTANGALSAYLYHHGLLTQTDNLVFEQGYVMNRPSEIRARLEIEDQGIQNVFVGGHAVIINS